MKNNELLLIICILALLIALIFKLKDVEAGEPTVYFNLGVQVQQPEESDALIENINTRKVIEMVLCTPKGDEIHFTHSKDDYNWGVQGGHNSMIYIQKSLDSFFNNK